MDAYAYGAAARVDDRIRLICSDIYDSMPYENVGTAVTIGPSKT